jgi:hypothetical protein
LIPVIGTAKRVVAGVLVLLLLAAPVPSIHQAGAESYVTDSAVHAPPTTGAYAYYATYGAFGPDQSSFPRVGESFVDPVFGKTIKRLTNELGQASFSEIYSKNGYFNANGTLVHHRTPSGHNIISTSTGQVVRAGVAFNYDSSFAPDDPDAWYYFAFGDTTLYKYSVATGNRTVVKTFPGALAALGGSVDWIDRTGRYMVLNIAGVTRVYDKQSDTLYAGSIPGNYGAGGGWRGISPDGNYVITSTDGSPTMSHSWRIDHATRTVSTTPVLFWTACGGHADVVSATNGKTYFVSFDCHTSISIYAVDVTLPQSASNVAQQLSQNRKLIQLTSWADSGHFSRVSRGALQDWMYVSVESGDDGFSSPVTGWRAFKQEILKVNVLTGEVRRLAHHRSRGLGSGSYYAQPRVSSTWDGSVVLWTSNFGHSGNNYADLYGMNVAAGSAPPPPPVPPPAPVPSPSPLAVNFVNPASGANVSGTITVSLTASGGSGNGYVYSLSAGGATVYTGTNNAFSWNTGYSVNGAVALTAKVTDSAGATAQSSRTVTVSNPTSGGGGTGSDTVLPTVAITAPTGTVWTGNSIRVAASATDNAGLARIELWGGGRIFATFPCTTTTCSGTTWWITGPLPRGSYIVNAVAIDKVGNRTRSTPVTIIKDATSPTYASGAPASSTAAITTPPPPPPTTSPTSPPPTTTPTAPLPTTPTADTIAPTAAITAPPSGTWTGNSLQVSMRGTDNITLRKLELYANGVLANTLACASATCSGTVTWISGLLPSGKHTLTAVATDASGNRTTSAPVIINK